MLKGVEKVTGVISRGINYLLGCEMNRDYQTRKNTHASPPRAPDGHIPSSLEISGMRGEYVPRDRGGF